MKNYSLKIAPEALGKWLPFEYNRQHRRIQDSVFILKAKAWCSLPQY
jgi:hypothetical protein